MRIPNKDNYSTHCQISHRPPFRTYGPLFYRCECCGSLSVINHLVYDADPEAPGRQGLPDNATREYPGFARDLPTVSCCGRSLKPLPVCSDSALIDEHRLEYTIFGGFEHNSMNITVAGGIHPMTREHRIEWIYVRGFQGGQLKMLPASGSSKANFSFADEDAYAYCDRPICRMGREHCQFLCKRELIIYAYCSRHGLFRLVL